MMDVRARRLAQDVALATGGLVLDLVGFSRILGGPEAFPPWVAGYAAVGFAALLVRRRLPRTVFAVEWVHAVVAMLLIPAYGPVVGVAIALFTLADLDTARAAGWALVISMVPTAGLAIGEAFNAPAGSALPAIASSFTVLGLVNAGAWSLGRWARAHRAELERAEEAQRAAIARAAADERVSIARDLHDIVSHSVGVMTLQAAGARTVLVAGRTERALQALRDIEGAGARAMVELRRMLALLRSADDADVAETDRRTPPGLRDLDAVVDGMRAVGLPVRLAVTGEPGELDVGSDLAAYRVVQESLTNALKHAGPGTPTLVELGWAGTELGLTIVNTAPVNPARRDVSATAGYGLVGLRERVESIGGTFCAGEQPDGGFRVQAVLPREPVPHQVPDPQEAPR